MAERLIVTNGQSAVEAMRRAGITGDILPWDDVLHDGPVPGHLSSAELASVRADFLAQGKDASSILQDLRARDRRLEAAGGPVVLWFEHDLYDQLQLLQVIERVRNRSQVLLVPEDTFIAERDSMGLSDMIRTAIPLTSAQVELAVRAWAAFSGDRPDDVAALLDEPETSSLPHLRHALLRWLESFPGSAGLGRVEHSVLRLLSDRPHSGIELFKETNALEQAAFRGDWSFWLLLAGLSPALVAHEGPSMAKGMWHVTSQGRKVLAGSTDRLTVCGIDSWRGGTHLTRDNDWRWEGGRLGRR